MRQPVSRDTVFDMAMTLRLNDTVTEALRRKAVEEGDSMQQVAQRAVAQYVTDRPARIRALARQGADENAELLARLAK